MKWSSGLNASSFTMMVRSCPSESARSHVIFGAGTWGLVVIAVPVIHKEIDRPGAAHETRHLAAEVAYVYIIY